VTSLRRCVLIPLVVCLGCVAQSSPSDLSRKIERQVRSYYRIPPESGVAVGEPSPSTQFPEYDAIKVTVDNGEKKQDLNFLVSKDRTSLIRLTKFDLTKDPFAETMSKIDLNGRPTRGAKSAKVIVVNFDDFECPFCSRLHQTLFPEILKEYGDRVTFVYKDDPLVEIHPWAMHAAVDANCLAAQSTDAYWAFADYIHSNQGEVNSEKTPVARFEALDKITTNVAQRQNLDVSKLQTCMKAQDTAAITASMKVAESLGIDGTPALYINGEAVNGGAVSANVVRAALDRALKEANVPVPQHAQANPAATPPSK
jgi:protein-disulfide isomerase